MSDTRKSIAVKALEKKIQDTKNELAYVQAFVDNADKDNFPCLTTYEFNMLDKGFRETHLRLKRLNFIYEKQLLKLKEQE